MKNLQKLFYFFLITATLACSTKDDTSCGEPIQEITLKASFSFGEGDVLIGSTVSFINNSEGLTDGTTYLWDFGDGTTSLIKSPSHSYESIGDGDYTVTLTVTRGADQDEVEAELVVYLSSDVSERMPLLDKLADTEILTCAHRGFHKMQNTGNSVEAVQAAIDEGIQMIEIDVRPTKDGHLVLMHDKDVDRTTDGSGDVDTYTLEELKKLRLRTYEGVLTSQQIPTLKEILVLARGKVYIDFDIDKKVNFQAIYPIVKQYGMLKQGLFYSSELDVIKEMLNTDPEVVVLPLIKYADYFDDYEYLENIKIVHYIERTFTQELVDKAKAKGWYIFMNAYVNTSTTPDDDDYEIIDLVSDLGGNIIQTDHPALVKEHLED